jgi:hypothetical protein
MTGRFSGWAVYRLVIRRGYGKEYHKRRCREIIADLPAKQK